MKMTNKPESIKIPDTIKYYYESKEHEEAIDLFYEKSSQPQNNFEDVENYAKACLYLNKLQYDAWKFRYDLWQSIWGNELKDFKEIIGFSDYEDFQNRFYVAYKINKKKYIFAISEVSSSDSELYIYAAESRGNEKKTTKEYRVMPKDEKNDLLENKQYTDCKEYYTRSKHHIYIPDDTITDDTIKEFRKAANELLRYIIQD